MWSHKKYKKQFKGTFKLAGTDRVFQLTEIDGKKVISFESWQQAKKQGWSKMS